MTWSVRDTPELRRILALPRRVPATRADGTPIDLVAEMTSALRTPRGTMTLRTHQALALHDIALYGGAFCPLGVGEGKTLITLLAPYVIGAKHPLLLLPANLIEKTNRDRAALTRHWIIPNHTRLMSVEWLGRVQAAAELDIYEPDLIIVDEAHKLKNKRAAVTRRVARYMAEHPTTRFVALSGTIMRKSLTEFGHILRWCLKENAPIPATVAELDEWASCLDLECVNELARFEAGALLKLCTPEELSSNVNPTRAARLGFRRRLVETPGIVATGLDGEAVACSIHVAAIQYEVAGVTERHFAKLRSDMLTPDDRPLVSGAEVWAHAKELALGFHYVQVEGSKYSEWRAAIRRNDASKTATTEQPTANESIAMTRRAISTRLEGQRGPATFSKADTESLLQSFKLSRTSTGATAASVVASVAGLVSTTITSPARFVDCSASSAIARSGALVTMSKDYGVRFDTFLRANRPPKDWLDARREWSCFVRETLLHSRTLDSELQVAQAVAAGRIDDDGRLAGWREIRDTFKPETVAVWHDSSALLACAEWMDRAPGIVWTEHTFFAEGLSELTGVPYFGAKGLTSAGVFVDDADPKRSAILSIDANREGRNLQTKWSRNLFVSPPEGSDWWQQAIGRTHRTGQTADEVTVDVFLGCAEHANAWRKAMAGAVAVHDTTGAPQKLLIADVEWPDDVEIGRFAGARWGVMKRSNHVDVAAELARLHRQKANVSHISK